MEQHYMSLIWHVIASKENQNLSVKEQQDKIVEILALMKKDVQSFTKSEFKKECFRIIDSALKTV